MSKRKYSASEKRAFRKGFFYALFKRRKKVTKKKINKSTDNLHEYKFFACDYGGHGYNICTYGNTYQEAYEKAVKKLRSPDDLIGLMNCNSNEFKKKKVVI